MKLGNLLDGKYGYSRSVLAGRAINAQGEPTPWYTYPALEYLDQFDFSTKTVFEWGSGNSSLYWARVAKSLTSVEDNTEWHGIVTRATRNNQVLRLVTDAKAYVEAISTSGVKYDIIVIDGSYRYECAVVASNHLEDGGLIILDNSDWLPETASVLRSRGLLEVDMSGIGPGAVLTWTTSFFFHRSFNMACKQSVQPRPSLGAVKAPNNPTGGYR